MSSEAKNLAAIAKAIEQHDRTCAEPLLAILLNPFEAERLGWDDFNGVPIQASDKIPTGRFELVCNGDGSRGPAHEAEGENPVDAVTRERELAPA
jgi:hypothetical protein